jgi:hypothetical protein
VVRAGLPWPHIKPWGADAIAGDRLLRREDGTLATYRLAGVDSVVPDVALATEPSCVCAPAGADAVVALVADATAPT